MGIRSCARFPRSSILPRHKFLARRADEEQSSERFFALQYSSSILRHSNNFSVSLGQFRNPDFNLNPYLYLKPLVSGILSSRNLGTEMSTSPEPYILFVLQQIGNPDGLQPAVYGICSQIRCNATWHRSWGSGSRVAFVTALVDFLMVAVHI